MTCRSHDVNRRARRHEGLQGRTGVRYAVVHGIIDLALLEGSDWFGRNEHWIRNAVAWGTGEDDIGMLAGRDAASSPFPLQKSRIVVVGP